MEELLSDRRLNTLHHRAVRWHREKVAELHASPDFAEMIAQIEAHRTRMVREEAAPPVEAGYQGDLDVPDDTPDERDEDEPAPASTPPTPAAAKAATAPKAKPKAPPKAKSAAKPARKSPRKPAVA